MQQQSEKTIFDLRKRYEAPALVRHQRLQKVTLGTVSPGRIDGWLQPGA